MASRRVKEVQDMLSTFQARPQGIAVYSATTAVTDVDTTVAKTEALSPGIAKHSATTGDGEARPPGTAKYGATVVATTMAKSIGDGEARPPGTAKSAWPQQNPYSQNLLVSFMRKLGPPGPEQVPRPASSVQQLRSLLTKLGLLSSRSTVPQKIRTTPRSGMRVKRRSTSAR